MKISQSFKNLIQDAIKIAEAGCEKSYLLSKDSEPEFKSEEKRNTRYGDVSHQPLPYADEAMKKMHYKLLFRFIKLSNIFMNEAKLDLIKNTVLKLIKLIQNILDNNESKRIIPFILVDLLYDNNGISQSPNFDALNELFTSNLIKGIELIC